MIKNTLLLLHTIGWYMFYPFEYLWRYVFVVKVNVKDKMMFVGEAGGGGKSTMSVYLASTYGHTHVTPFSLKNGTHTYLFLFIKSLACINKYLK